MDGADQPAVKPGDVLAGKYEIVRVIGRGGMAVVFEGIHRRLGKRVAIKVLHGEATKVPELLRRFEREAMAAAQLESPHVARVTDVESTPDGTAFMVMEYLEGNDLDTELYERDHLDVEEAVDYVLEACVAMIEAHELGIVHRDLKPQNLFLAREGGKTRIKVLDFGISKFQQRGDSTVTQTTSSFGTPLYMSPEQIRSTKHVDGRSDIWSLGVILYELLAGKPPFFGTTPTAVVAAISADRPMALNQRRAVVPQGLSDVVAKALAKRPDDRFDDVRAFAQALAPYGSARGRRALAQMGVSTAPDAQVSSVRVPKSTPEVFDAPTEPAWDESQGPWAASRSTRLERARPWLAVGALLAVVAAVLFLALGGDETSETQGADEARDTAAAVGSETLGTGAASPDPTAAHSSLAAQPSGQPNGDQTPELPSATSRGPAGPPVVAKPRSPSQPKPRPSPPSKPTTRSPQPPVTPPKAGDHPLHL